MTIIDRRISVAEGTAVKAPVRAATTANITLSGEQTIDGIAVVEGDRVLVKDQTTGTENGIYTCSTGTWLRTRDFDGAFDAVKGTRVWVTSGTLNGNTEFVCTTSDPITIDSSIIAFSSYPTLVTAAPSNVDFVVKTANGNLSAERVLTDSSADGGVTWDWATASQVKGNVQTASETVKGVVELATTTEATAGTDTARAVTAAGVAAAIAAGALPIAGGFRTLVIQNNSGTPNTQVDLTADAVTVETTGGVAYRLRTVSLTIDFATTGALGLDTGALASSTWYSIWVIYNPSTQTVSGLGSTSATAPTMPSGYTAKARYGWFITDGSSHFLRIIQKGRTAQYVNGSRLIANGTSGTYSATSCTLTSTSVAGFVPSTASAIRCVAINGLGGSTANILVAPSTGWNSTGPRNNYFPAHMTGQDMELSFEMILEGTTIGYASNGSGGGVGCAGWEDNI